MLHYIRLLHNWPLHYILIKAIRSDRPSAVVQWSKLELLMTVEWSKMANIAVILLFSFVSFGITTAQDATCACLNGGTFSGNRCVCPTGYVGLFCEQQETATSDPYVPCDSSCNNGYCDYTCGSCVCHPFYTGDYCNITLIRPCGDYYCFNEGTCETNTSSDLEYCQCPQGYTGEYCLFADDACLCLNGGTCDTSGDTTTCSCPAAFTGEHCETEICTPACPTNAFCCNGTCQCYPGYTGDSCTEVESGVLPWAPCGDYYCFNGGSCQNNTCQCTDGFSGDYCHLTDCANSTDIEGLQTCGAHACYYGGTCVDDTCQCPPFTFGVYCEYVTVPTSRPTIDVTAAATSVSLIWNVPFQYESIASAGGVWYTVNVEDMATGRMHTVTANDVMLSYSTAQSTEYCFTVRAEVSGGSGGYSNRECTTTQAHGSCFCVNGVYDPVKQECTCQAGYHGSYCEVPTVVEARCPVEAEYNNALGHTFNWAETGAGEFDHLPCPCQSTLDITRDIFATRACFEGGRWRDTDDRECTVNTVATLCQADNVCDLLAKVQSAISGGTLQSGAVAAILTAVELLAKDTCSSSETSTSETLLGAVASTLSSSDDVLERTRESTNAATTLVKSLDAIAKGALSEAGTDSPWTQTIDDIVIWAAAVAQGDVPQDGYNIPLEGARSRLSNHLFGLSCNSSVVTSSIINKKALFGGKVEGEDDRQVVSPILSVTVGNCSISGDQEAIEITFTVPQSAEYSTMECYYWKTTANQGLGAWSRNGCSKKPMVRNGEVVCSCMHLTTFAVLQKVAPDDLSVIYYAAGGGGAALLLLILLTCVIVLAVCCIRRKKHTGAHGFIQDTELPVIPVLQGEEEAAATKEGYFQIDVSTLDRGNHYDSFQQENIYAEIAENAENAKCAGTDTADAEKANLVPSGAGEEKGDPLDLYDSAEVVNGVTANGKEDGPIDNYECMTAVVDSP